MSAIRVYLAGPMTGHPDYNRAGFDAAAQWVTNRGLEPVNPHDTDPSHNDPCPEGQKHKGHPNACWYAASLRVLAGCDAIVLLPGWMESTGARLEYAEAARLGLPVIHYTPAPAPAAMEVAGR